MINVAINGFGRIGRNVLRALYKRPKLHERLRVVAINDLGTPEINAHLLQFDTTHGRFAADVEVTGDGFLVNGDPIVVSAKRDPNDLPWADLVWMWCWSVPVCLHLEMRRQHIYGPVPRKC